MCLVGVYSVLSIWFWIMHCFIPTPTTNSSSSTGMIWVTLNILSAANHQWIVGEFHIAWRVVTLWLIGYVEKDIQCESVWISFPIISQSFLLSIAIWIINLMQFGNWKISSLLIDRWKCNINVRYCIPYREEFSQWSHLYSLLYSLVVRSVLQFDDVFYLMASWASRVKTFVFCTVS